MMVLLILTGLVATGMFIGLFAATTAPVGYQDESGFHYGPDHCTSSDDLACGVTQPEMA